MGKRVSAIRDSPHTMRAARSAEQGIKLVSDERNISHTTDQTARVCARLAGRQIVDDRRAEAVGSDFGKARVESVKVINADSAIVIVRAHLESSQAGPLPRYP